MKCPRCGKEVRNKFILGLTHYCFPILESYRIEKKIYECKQLDEKTGELTHKYYFRKAI